MTNPTYNLLGSLTGVSGIKQTLQRMAQIVTGYKTAPWVRETALSVLSSIPEKNFQLEAATLLRYVQDRIRYTLDVAGVETLQTPVQTLRLNQGDCDDQSMLLASMLMSVGLKARFAAVGQVRNVYSHVLVQVNIGGQWVFADPIMRGWPLGKAPPYESILIQEID